MINIKTFLLLCILSFGFSACATQQETQKQIEKNKAKKTDFLMETKDINNIKELEVSNNLIQILPVINITGVEILIDENIIDQKPILFRNEKCLFSGTASAEPTSNRIEVKLTKATCKTSYKHKVNYEINGWVFGKDEVFGLKAKKTVEIKELGDDKTLETKTLYIKKGEYVYLLIDMVKQIETINIKAPNIVQKKQIIEDKTKIMRIQR